jgi:hypothetical protein
MKLSKSDWIIFIMVCFLAGLAPSCASRSREASCRGNNTYRAYNPKKNKSRYGQKYDYKNHSVRKDYVIKNGIAR